MSEIYSKPEAVLEAIRCTDVGSNIILQNNDMSIWCILKVICKEHPEDKTDDGGEVAMEIKEAIEVLKEQKITYDLQVALRTNGAGKIMEALDLAIKILERVDKTCTCANPLPHPKVTPPTCLFYCVNCGLDITTPNQEEGR